LVDRRVLSRAEFLAELERVGVVRGATIYVHSSMDEVRRRVPGLEPVELINVLKELVGEDGTLLAPTFPFSGRQYEYVQTHRVFDVKRTPSMVGLFTELFRRSQGVTRSRHPTHPIAAWGKRSHELVAEHHLGTAFGERSPVYKMQYCRGRVVGIGVTPSRCYTLYHVAEELHPASRAMHYCTETVEMTIVDGASRTTCPVRPLRADRRRRYDRAEKILRREGILLSYRRKGLRFSGAAVGPFLERAHELISANRFYPRGSGQSGAGVFR
jgi:aminoglycoside N3'-acetyltransferase